MAKSTLTATEWSSIVVSGIMLILIVIFGVLHSEYLTSKLEVIGTVRKLQGRCVSAECMEAAAWLMGNMDETIDPCDNFYDRACGNYAEQHPFKSYATETSVLSTMKEKNMGRLQEIISSTPVRSQWGHMYEVAKMVNSFYKACIDQYQRSKNYGDRNNPLLKVLRDQLNSAWWVNDPAATTNFDWQAAMRSTSRDQNFVFFRLLPVPKASDVSKNVLEISYDNSITFNWRKMFYSRNQTNSAFRIFLVQLGQMLARDNGTNTTDRAVVGRIYQFADDVVNITATFSRPVLFASLFGEYNDRYHRVFNYSDFKGQPGNSFVDWDNLIGAYTDNKMALKRDTRVVEHFHMRSLQYSYSSAVAQLLSKLNRNDPNFKRKMNNYFAFRIAFYWMPDLNYEYNHLFQMYQALFHDVTEFPDDWELCMSYADWAMPKTLSALYVSKFYRRDEEKTVLDVSLALVKSLTAEVRNLPWMDAATKQAALDKLSKVTFKIGKPVTWVNDDAIANELTLMYGNVAVSPTDHFANVKALVEVLRQNEIRQLTKGSNPYDHWRSELYDVNIEYYARWNEVLIPAGILQEPIVSPKLPAYMNFGGLGSWIASILLKAIDEDGQIYDANYAKTRWWSQPTWDNYGPMRQSVIDFYGLIVPPALKDHVNTTSYASFAIAETGGLRQAYTAYKRYLADQKISERPLPSLAHGNIDQMFFYSYASTHCADYTSYTYAWRTIYAGIVPEFIHVNGAVGLMDEFGKAFQCHAGAAMVAPETKKVPFIF